MKKIEIFELVEEPKEKRTTLKRFIVNFIIIFIVVFLSFYEFPYYISKPGGLDNINNRIEIENAKEAQGSINLTYVSELKGTLPLLLLAYLIPDWDIVSKEEENIGTLDYDTMLIREKELLKQSYMDSIKYAYEKAHKKVIVTKENCYVAYVDEKTKSDFKVGDQLIEIDGVNINKLDDFINVTANKKSGDSSKVVVLNNKKKYTRQAEYYADSDGRPIIGIGIASEYELETDPKYKFTYSKNEYGPSGGLMIALAVYNSLTEQDITAGKKIAGTGTLDSSGNVGLVGGIEYKLKGANKNHADVFLVPFGENYDEAMKIKKKNNYKIEIVGVKTFDEALEYLEKNLQK